MFSVKTIGAAVVGATISMLPVGNAQAAQLVMDFSNNAGLGFGVGTNQTITQNGIQMQSIAGLYEITQNPFHELNLKDFGGNGTTRTVEFSLLSGNAFDFIGFDRQDAFGNATITSSGGGNITFNLFSPVDFSGLEWKNLTSIRVSTSQQFGEFKFNSFTFDDEPTTTPIPTPALLPGLIGMGIAAWRKRKGESSEQVAETADV